MEQKIIKRKLRAKRSKMKRIANGDEPTVLIPSVIKPVEVQVALRTTPIEVRAITVAVTILPDRTNCAKYHPCHCLLNILKAVSYSGY